MFFCLNARRSQYNERKAYKERHEGRFFDLMSFALELAEITDQTVDEHGLIKMCYKEMYEAIQRVQRSTKHVRNELSWIALCDADNSEIYPDMKGRCILSCFEFTDASDFLFGARITPEELYE